MIGEERKKIIFSTSFLFFIPVNYKDNTEFQLKKATTKHEKLRKQIAFLNIFQQELQTYFL